MHDIKFQLIEGGEKMIDEFWNGMNKKLEITFPEIDFRYKKKPFTTLRNDRRRITIIHDLSFKDLKHMLAGIFDTNTICLMVEKLFVSGTKKNISASMYGLIQDENGAYFVMKRKITNKKDFGDQIFEWHEIEDFRTVLIYKNEFSNLKKRFETTFYILVGQNVYLVFRSQPKIHMVDNFLKNIKAGMKDFDNVKPSFTTENIFSFFKQKKMKLIQNPPYLVERNILFPDFSNFVEYLDFYNSPNVKLAQFEKWYSEEIEKCFIIFITLPNFNTDTLHRDLKNEIAIFTCPFNN
jgi:hypothetical protein